jgi:dihydrofolate reductase
VATRQVPHEGESEGLVRFLNNSPAEVIGIALSEYGEPVLVEGGVNFLQPLIEQRLIDTFYLTRSRKSGDGDFLDPSLLNSNYEIVDSESIEENEFELWLPRKQQSTQHH